MCNSAATRGDSAPRPRRKSPRDVRRDCIADFAHALNPHEHWLFQHSQNRSAQRVVPRVRDHSRAQALSPPREQPKQQSINSDQQHARDALRSRVTLRKRSAESTTPSSVERLMAANCRCRYPRKMISSQKPAVALRQNHTTSSRLRPGVRKPSCLRMLSILPAWSRCMSFAQTPSTTARRPEHSRHKRCRGGSLPAWPSGRRSARAA